MGNPELDRSLQFFQHRNVNIIAYSIKGLDISSCYFSIIEISPGTKHYCISKLFLPDHGA